MKIEPVFIFSCDRRGLDVLRGVLDSFAGEADIDFGVRPTHPLNPEGGNQHFLARPPIPRCHLDIADRPGFIVHDEPIYVADLAIGRLNVIASNGFDTRRCESFDSRRILSAIASVEAAGGVAQPDG